MLLKGASPSLSRREKINDLEVATDASTDAKKRKKKTIKRKQTIINNQQIYCYFQPANFQHVIPPRLIFPFYLATPVKMHHPCPSHVYEGELNIIQRLSYSCDNLVNEPDSRNLLFHLHTQKYKNMLSQARSSWVFVRLYNFGLKIYIIRKCCTTTYVHSAVNVVGQSLL